MILDRSDDKKPMVSVSDNNVFDDSKPAGVCLTWNGIALWMKMTHVIIKWSYE